MRKDVTPVMESTLKATFQGAIGFGIISPFLSLAFTAGDGMGPFVVGAMLVTGFGTLLSATIAFLKVTIKYMTFIQTVAATIVYGMALAFMAIAVVNGVYPLNYFIATNIPENWGSALSAFNSILMIVLFFLPSMIATCLAKIIYPRVAVPM